MRTPKSGLFLTILSFTAFCKVDRRTGRLIFDREFALVDTSGVAMRLHSHPQMSQIHATIDLRSKIMTVTAPDRDNLILSLEIVGSAVSPHDVEVCGILCKGCVFWLGDLWVSQPVCVVGWPDTTMLAGQSRA